VAAVTSIYDQLGVREQAEHSMKNYADRAFNALDAIALPHDRKQYLREFADNLLVREF